MEGKRLVRKPTEKQVKEFLLHCVYIVLGNMIAAAATALFITPNDDFVMGGTTGLGIFVKNLLQQFGRPESWQEWAVPLTVYTLNIALFLIGAILLGKKFAAATLAGTLLYPTFITLFTLVNDAYVAKTGGPIAQDEPMLALICGSLMFGLGLGITLRIGASTGGTDIPPLIFHRFFGWPIAPVMWLIDSAIIALQLICKPLETVLYGVLIALITSVVVDLVSPIGMKKSQVKIISKKNKEIREMLLNKLHRGVTMFYARTGFLQERRYVLMTIVSNRDVFRLKNEVLSIDPEAFIMVSVVSEVSGRGFSKEKIALPLSEEKEGLDEPEDSSE